MFRSQEDTIFLLTSVTKFNILMQQHACCNVCVGSCLILLFYDIHLCDIYHCCVYSKKTPDDGQRNCPKHVEFYSKNNFEKSLHLVGFIPDPVRWQSANLYDIYHCCVYSQKLLMIDRETFRNMQSFIPNINLRNQCIQLVLFLILLASCQQTSMTHTTAVCTVKNS